MGVVVAFGIYTLERDAVVNYCWPHTEPGTNGLQSREGGEDKNIKDGCKAYFLGKITLYFGSRKIALGPGVLVLLLISIVLLNFKI